MRCRTCLFAVLAAALAGPAARAQPPRKPGTPPGLQPAALAAQADVVVIGKVIEIEPDPVEAAPFPASAAVRIGPDGKPVGGESPAKVPYKVAMVKIEERLLGAGGLTQLRVGFPADAAPPGAPAGPADGGPGVGGRVVRPGRVVPVALSAGMEGCFFLSRHQAGEFYALAFNGVTPPLLKKDERYARDLEQVKKAARVIEEPVDALKAKDLADRFYAAELLLRRYQTTWAGKYDREPVPAEENKLLLDLLIELPWLPKGAPRAGEPELTRGVLWGMINPTELGFRPPKTPARKPNDPPPDVGPMWEEATAAFLKENRERIRIQRYKR